VHTVTFGGAAIHAVSRFEALRSAETPLVGREEELELLSRRWKQARGGEGRVVLISGEPAIGKSRLTAELQQRIETEPHARLRYFCSPHHQDSALRPFIGQLERAEGFARDDATATKLSSMTTARTTKTDEPALFPLPLLPSRGPDPQRHVPRPAASTKPTKANAAMHPVVMSEQAFCAPEIQAAAFYADENVLIFNMEVCKALRLLAAHRIAANCIVTSPPFYGQRDYEVHGQIGLEEHPKDYIRNLVQALNLCKPILVSNGSMWVNLGDTYWAGKGEYKSGEVKQSARRFGLRPRIKRATAGSVCRSSYFLFHTGSPSACRMRAGSYATTTSG
jgi:hypothetical protein